MTTETPVFDPSKPHGTVHGHPEFRFYQNGYHFGPSGNYIPEGTPSSNPVEEDGLDFLHWKKLQKLLEENGGEWSNKLDAITWLRERGIRWSDDG